jgi:hypothetical protein
MSDTAVSGFATARPKYSLAEKFQAQVLGVTLEDDNEGMADILKSEAKKRSLDNLDKGYELVSDKGVPKNWVEQVLGIKPQP